MGAMLPCSLPYNAVTVQCSSLVVGHFISTNLAFGWIIRTLAGIATLGAQLGICRTLGSQSSVLLSGMLNQERIVDATGPGRWNDLDQLMIGNGNLTVEQMRAHMA